MILRRELTLKGAWNSSISPLPINEWKMALKFMDRGQLKGSPLISHRFRLEECRECFKMMKEQSEVFSKVLFKPEESL
jgi:L-iditol 2-dehydrogenase